MVLLSLTGVAFPLVVGYHVDPVKAEWSGKVWGNPKHGGISEVVTCCWDQLDSASGGFVELFQGDTMGHSSYLLGIYEQPGGVKVAGNPGRPQGNQNSWLRFEVTMEPGKSFTKGRQYEFRFTRPGSDSIQYYYQSGNPYRYGHMHVGSADQTGKDLCCRVHGRMNPVDSTWWGYTTFAYDTVSCDSHDVHGKARSAGVGMARIELLWAQIWPDSTETFQFAKHDSQVAYATRAMGCKVIGLLDYTAGWASSRSDRNTHCPPTNLYSAATDPENYWYRYVRGVVEHYDTIIHVWEIWNEPNDTATFWKIPDTYYTIGGDTARDMSKLYARLCVVAESAIKSVAPEDTVLIGSLVCLQAGVGSRMNPAGMLSYCYQYGQGGWDAVSEHHYSDSVTGFVPAAYEAYAETLRAVMRANDDYGELWLTETGWPARTADTLYEQARYLCKAFTAAAGTNALPQGGYDRICYYSFREGGDGFGVLDPVDGTSRPAYHAAYQTANALTGKRLNGRVMTDDTVTNPLVRMYEFEDARGKRTWVCWTDSRARQNIDVRLPVRTNSLAAESLAYSRTTPAFSPTVANDGWLYMNLNSRPVFVSEKTSPQRPDLRVDSVKVVRSNPSIVHVWVTNHGTRATPFRSGSRTPYPTWAVLKANGDSLAQQVRTTSIGVNRQAEFSFDLGQTKLPDTALLSVVVNPGQTYSELGTDDNTGYALAAKH